MRRAGMSMAASWSTARDRETDRARNGLVKALETTAVAVPFFGRSDQDHMAENTRRRGRMSGESSWS